MAEAKEYSSSLSKAQKAALIFLLLEEKGAASLFDQMTDDEIKIIGSTLLSMKEIPVNDMTFILSEFYNDMGINEPDHFSGRKMFEKLVDKTIPAERRGKILKVEDIKGGKGSKHNPLEYIFVELTTEQVYKMIRTEHPQTIAVILTLIKPGLSKQVLNLFDADAQTDLLYRMSVLSKIPEDMIRMIAQNYREKLSAGIVEEEEDDGNKVMEVPGADLVLKFLKTQSWESAEKIIIKIEQNNPEIAAVLRKKFFTIEDMLRADNNGVRNLLKNIETATLSIALKGKEPEIQDKFFQNMSTRAATILKEDIEVMPEQKEEDVQASIDKILTEAKRLIGEGQMKLEPLSEN